MVAYGGRWAATENGASVSGRSDAACRRTPVGERATLRVPKQMDGPRATRRQNKLSW